MIGLPFPVVPAMFDDQTLLDYVRDLLPQTRSRDVEAALRDQPDLRARLALILDHNCGNEIAPGTLWRESRLTCPTREEWGTYLLGVLDQPTVEYYRFHLETVECPYCRANVEDLRELQSGAASQNVERQERIYRSSVGAVRLNPHPDSRRAD